MFRSIVSDPTRLKTRGGYAKRTVEGLLLVEIQQNVWSGQKGDGHSSVNHDGCPVAVFIGILFVFSFRYNFALSQVSRR